MSEQRPVHVALVEDDPGIAFAIVRMFRLMGVRAEHFASAEALLRAADVQPQCYVVDNHLPGMSGLELNRKLRSMLLSTPVILITADDDPDLALDARAAGANAVLVKPFTGRALAETVRNCTASR